MTREEKYEFRKLMTNYDINRSFISKLEQYGLKLEMTRRHTKIYRKDHVGGTVFIASTPSDWRAGKNAAARLIRLLEAA